MATIIPCTPPPFQIPLSYLQSRVHEAGVAQICQATQSWFGAATLVVVVVVAATGAAIAGVVAVAAATVAGAH